MARNVTGARIQKFNGLQDARKSRAVGREGLVVADNVDLDNDRYVSRRPGVTKISSLAIDAAWGDGAAFLFTSGEALYRLNEDETTTQIVTGLTPSSVLAALTFDQKQYWSNGYETGVVFGNTNRSFGLAAPDAPTVSKIGGNLPEGTYAFAISYVRDNGLEGGLSNETVLSSDDKVGFSITTPTSHPEPDVNSVNVYVSSADGRTLFLLATLALGQTVTFFDDNARRLGIEGARLQGVNGPPAFQAIDEYNGRILVGSGEYLFYSNPFAYEHFDRRYGYTPVGGHVECIAAVDGGVFVGTEKEILFFAGADFAQADVQVKAEYGVVSGYQPQRVEAHEVAEASGAGAFILSDKGYVLCTDGGGFANVTDGVAKFPAKPVSGSGVVRRRNGLVHIVSTVTF